MVRAAEIPRPLSRREITDLLQSLYASDIDAFAVTATSLYGWCHPDDVSAALALIASMPIPRCLHGKQWDICIECPSQRQSAAPN